VCYVLFDSCVLCCLIDLVFRILATEPTAGLIEVVADSMPLKVVVVFVYLVDVVDDDDDNDDDDDDDDDDNHNNNDER
jgi:hypothetical protein